MTYPSRSSGSARRERCRCGRTVLRQLVGNRAALYVTADAAELTPDAAALLREPDRLDWCMRTTKHGLDMRWADCHRRREDCPHPHVIDHRCAPKPRPRKARTTSVPEGQLTLG